MHAPDGIVLAELETGTAQAAGMVTKRIDRF
jgi:hypothetical protein